MKKKIVWMGIGGTVGCMLLLTSVYAGVGDYAGYDAYKSALKQTAAVHSVTGDIQVTVQDNNKTVVALDAVIKSDLTKQSSSGSVEVKSGATDQSISTYKQDGKQIVKRGDSEVFTILDLKSGRWQENKHREALQPDSKAFQEGENIIDSLVGNLRSQVMLNNNSDGSKEISVDLKGSQLPAVFNAISSLIIKNGGQGMAKNAVQKDDLHGLLNTDFVNNLPKLETDIAIRTIAVKAEVDANNHIKTQAGSVTIYGKDAAGADHEVTITLNIALSNFDQTTPDSVDLTGKQTVTLHNEDFAKHNDGE